MIADKKYGLKVKLPLITLAAIFLAIIPGDPAFGEDGGSYGDAMVVASIGDARTLVPILASDSASAEICSMVFNGLVKYDKDVRIVGDLAESWEILDGGLRIIFHLRKGVKWHDGAPFTSRDVEFTYKKLTDTSVRTPYSGDFERIKELKVIDEHTVSVEYKEPFSPALASWGMWMMPEHILKNEDLNKTDFSRRPVGTGPYVFRSWRTGEKIELRSNRDYFEGRPFIDRYIFRIIPDDATIFLELQTRGVDMSGLTPLQYSRQTDNRFFRDNYRKFRYPGFGYTYLGYNLSDPKFTDRRVRQAINLAVNRNEIVKTIFFGLADVTTGPFVPGTWAYNKEVRPAPYDPGRAAFLLREAGWIDINGDGWLENGLGSIFEFTILVNQGNNERLRTAEMIQGYLKKIGVKVKIRVLEWSAMLNDFINKKRFEAVLMGWSLGRDPDCYDIWHSSKTREGEFNFIGYSNPEVDRLLLEARGVFGQDERAFRYRRMHELIYEDQPYLFLYAGESLPIVSSRFRNIEVSPIGIGYNFIRWYAPENEQRYK